MSDAKQVSHVHAGSGSGHWVGDGFPVRSIFSHQQYGQSVSPFLLLDYAGPYEFKPSDRPRGVEQHPHKGFETVTIVYEGEVDHRDSSGGGGSIGPGDVQWMTAASGLVHEEMHGRDFTRRGGVLEMIQLWVNLPAKDKSDAPHYQAITQSQIPTVDLPGSAGTARIIAGTFGQTIGPAKTYTPINLWDLHLAGGDAPVELPVPDGHNTLLLVRRGQLTLSDGQTISDAGLAIFDRAGTSIAFTAAQPVEAMLLDGLPIDEPIAQQGPFVMNTDAELRQAFADFRAGKMGRL